MSTENETNVLLKELPRFRDPSVLKESLRYTPIDHNRVRNLDLGEKMELLSTDKHAFEPTPQTLKVALTIIAMIRGGYRSRNPDNPKFRRKLREYLSDHSASAVEVWSSGFPHRSAFVIKGITATGKSLTVKRTLSLLPVALVHNRSELNGDFSRVTQVIWVYVEMPDEGSRGGLIDAILADIDDALETSYLVDYNKNYRTVDRRAAALVRLLHTHWVGILVIDELQARKIGESSQSAAMQMFLLSIINSGIPVVLMGNPMGFEWIDNFSQDVTRAYEVPPAIFHPCLYGPESDEWCRLYECIKRHYVLNRFPENDVDISKTLWYLSGGIQGYAMSLWKSAQEMRLTKMSGSGQMVKDDLIKVYQAEGFDKKRQIAQAFATQNHILLQQFSDIPCQDYGKLWGKIGLNQNISTGEMSPDQSVVQDIDKRTRSPTGKKMSEPSKLKSRQTRKRNKDKKRQQIRKGLSSEDLRGKADGIQSVLLNGLADTIEGLMSEVDQVGVSDEK